MIWKCVFKNKGLMEIPFSVGGAALVIPFFNEVTGEYKFFGKTVFEDIGEQGILKLLNSPTPAQSGE